MADAYVLPDLGDLIGDVPDGDGSEPAGREPHTQHDKADDWVDRLGEGGDRARLGVVDCGAISSLRHLPADGEEQPRRAEIGKGEAVADGPHE